MQQFVDQGQIAGAVTVVGRHDLILSYEAVGLRDIEARQPMTKDTLFRIASMTKPITAIGIMILAEEGKLSVDDPVEKHLPEFHGQMLASHNDGSVVLKPPARKITIRDLLTHTSGLPSGLPPDMADLYLKRDRTLAEVIPTIAKRPLEFEPGSRWAYCNAGHRHAGADHRGRFGPALRAIPATADLHAPRHGRHHVLSRRSGSAAASPRSTIPGRASWCPWAISFSALPRRPAIRFPPVGCIRPARIWPGSTR